MVLVRGQHNEVPDPAEHACPLCFGADPMCDKCDGYGKWWDPVDYDAYADIYVGDERISLHDSLKHRNHSPTGFSWGYSGSGPAQTALGILLAVTTPAEAMANYQRFKADVIARLCKDEPFAFTLDYDVWKEATDNSGIRMLAGQAY
jgi:hypothetical protein